MTAEERRAEILRALHRAGAPLSAGALAQRLGVSRQVVVGDVALLRAAGSPVLATPRGYVLQTAGAPDGLVCTVACRHSAEQIADELYAVVDCGCRVLDVIVEHPVYGQLSGQLQISSRYDADAFCEALRLNHAQPLCRLTGDIHLHTLWCPTPEQRDKAVAALRTRGYLV